MFELPPARVRCRDVQRQTSASVPQAARIGNPLTYNDPLAGEYGRDRFGWGESFHATMSKRFGLLREKSWFRRKAQVETEFAVAFSAIHCLLLARARAAEPGDVDAAQAVA